MPSPTSGSQTSGGHVEGVDTSPMSKEGNSGAGKGRKPTSEAGRPRMAGSSSVRCVAQEAAKRFLPAFRLMKRGRIPSA